MSTQDGKRTTPLPYLAAIRLSGEDAGKFLHDQVSADVLGLADGEATLACYCEPKGRVLALLLICRRQQDYVIVLARELAAAITARLKIYVFRARVDIEQFGGAVVLAGPEEGGPVAEGLPLPLDAPGSETGEYLMLSTGAQGAETDGARVQQRRFTELQRGVAWLGPASSGQFLPQMLGFDRIGAVNYKKGCYPGQEIVARAHYLGTIKRHPRVLLTADGIDLQPMEKITVQSGEETHEAVVVESARDAGGRTCLLCVTRMDPELEVTAIEGSAVLSR